MSKFILYGNSELFSSHGAITVKEIFDAIHSEKGLDPSFMVAGFFNRKEYKAKIVSVEPADIKKYSNVIISGALLNDFQFKVFDEQEFSDIQGNHIKIDELKIPNTQIVSLNGMLLVKYVDTVDNIDEQFYTIECNEGTPSLYCDNILLYPIKESENNPFFIKSEKKKRESKKK